MKDRILRHLQDYGSITSWEAIQEYGCTIKSLHMAVEKRRL